MKPLGPTVPPVGCTYSADLSTAVCGKTALFHFVADDQENVLVCADHLHMATCYGFTDWHLVDHRCILTQLVGGHWVYSEGEIAGHCQPEQDDFVEVDAYVVQGALA